MTSFFHRLDKYMIYKGLNDNKITVEAGISNGLIGKARKRGSLSQENISKILNAYPELDANWLLMDKGEMLKKDITKAIPTTASAGIPLIPIEAMAGNGGGSVSIKEENIMERYIVPDFVDVDFMIRVKGSSMYPKYSSGDIVACKMIVESNFFQWGRVFVLHHKEQGTMVKRLFPADGTDGLIECRSDNEKYPPFKLDLSEVTNIAMVTGVIRLE